MKQNVVLFNGPCVPHKDIIKQLILYIVLYFIAIECSEVKLSSFLNIPYAEKNKKITTETNISLVKEYSFFLLKSVLCNYIIFQYSALHANIARFDDSPFT